MAYWTTARFIHTYGFPAFQLLTSMLNDGKQLKDIAVALGISVSQVCRYAQAMFEVVYVPKDGARSYLEEFADKTRIDFERKRKFIGNNIIELRAGNDSR